MVKEIQKDTSWQSARKMEQFFKGEIERNTGVNRANAHSSLGLLYYFKAALFRKEMGNKSSEHFIKKAIELFEKAISLGAQKSFPVIFAKCYQNLGQKEKALEILQKALLENSKDINILLLLAEFKESTMSYREARTYYRSLLKLPLPDDNLRFSHSYIKGCIESCEHHWKLEYALVQYQRNNYKKSNIYFEDFFKEIASSLHRYDDYSDQYDIFLTAILKSKRRNVELNEKNSIYIKLENYLKELPQRITKHSKNYLSEENDAKTIATYGYGDVVYDEFNKPKTVSDILKYKSRTLLHNILEHNYFALDSVVLLNRVFRRDTYYYLALETNLIKQLLLDKWFPEKKNKFNREFEEENYEEEMNNGWEELGREEIQRMNHQTGGFWSLTFSPISTIELLSYKSATQREPIELQMMTT